MNDHVISVSSLGKQYLLGQRTPYRTLRETIAGLVGRSLARRSDHIGSLDGRHFWALKDVSFAVQHGEVVGIIGRNGAGKSTLLKILSRITEPTLGSARLRGRVGSLLEVGTGFHPELTGRENIYLNGAILGMSRSRINQRFDEIVSFAGVEEFLDVPVKRYSSGMSVRLAFAVAAHLEPQVLIVDEVLAVGDAEFQRKCIGKMSGVARSGRTVLFVSHNLAAVQSLCRRALLLESGRLVMDDSPQKVIERYRNSTAENHQTSLAERTDRRGSGEARALDIRVRGDESAGPVAGGEACFELTIACPAAQPPRDLDVTVSILDDMGTRLFGLRTRHTIGSFRIASQRVLVRCRVPVMPLIPGQYGVEIRLAVGDVEADFIEDACRFVVGESDFFGSGRLPNRARHGPILVAHSWELRDAPHAEQPS